MLTVICKKKQIKKQQKQKQMSRVARAESKYLHYENMPIPIYRIFYNLKKENFQIKNSYISRTSAKNMDCGTR